MNKINQPIQVIGFSIVTDNEAAFKENTIGKLWENFANSKLSEKLSNITSPKVFAVYSDYESDHNGKYRLTVGHAVSDIDHLPAGLTAVVIPTGDYQNFKAKSMAPEDIIATWKNIWQTDATKLRRTYKTDFEEYNEDGMSINISCEHQ